jgi:DNA (cytosine-5)-methyltransferase 1
MTHLDLFTGIGGFHLAAEWAGFETVGFAEIDRYCCQLLAEKWPLIKNYGDIRNADFSELRGRITVLSAGVPCQPASLAGKRRGSKDDRWLWPATLDVVGSVQPAWCIFENPPGILSLDEFGGVLLRLESLGYEVRLFSVHANAVGAKHRRQRVFIVANRQGDRRQAGELQDRAINGSAIEEGWLEHQGKRNAPLAESTRELRNGCGNARPGWRNELADGGETLADANSTGRREHLWAEPVEPQLGSSERDVWQFRLTEPPLCRRADGIPNRSHRLKALGNAVVPQQAFPFFAAIYQVETCL